jgi:hypothetical protein
MDYVDLIWLSISTDSAFLLRFLRTKKFSIPLAQEMLERYLVIRQLYPHWFRGLDIDDPAISDLLQEGYIVPLPQRDDFGRQVILTCAGNYLYHNFLSCLCTSEDWILICVLISKISD